LGEGREAETLAWGEGRVLRLLKDPSRTDRLERELAALTAARRGGAPVPAVYGRETVNGRPGLVIERVEGPDLLRCWGGNRGSCLASREGLERHTPAFTR
jgi:aminoglycoside phosphotransferase (APT) family kinase protein